MTDIVRKVQAACAFGTPDAFVTMEIVDEVQALVNLSETLGKIQDLFTKWAMGDLSGPQVLTKMQEVLDGRA